MTIQPYQKSLKMEGEMKLKKCSSLILGILFLFGVNCTPVFGSSIDAISNIPFQDYVHNNKIEGLINYSISTFRLDG